MATMTDEVRTLIREALLDAWALVQPVDCLGCSAPDRACCRQCRAAIRAVAARPVRCDADPGAPVWAASDYDGPVRQALLALKEHARTDAARRLAPLLRASLAGLLDSGVGETRLRAELAPIPTTRRALIRRGDDPLRRIVRCAALPASRVLRPRRTWIVGAQKHRDRAGRLAASTGRFVARRRLDARAFILVDDVATTGATLAAAAAAIRAAGGTVLGCAVVAAPRLTERSVIIP